MASIGGDIARAAARRAIGPKRTKSAALRRDIVVIGASTGGIEALKCLLGRLAPDFPAAVFVVLHTHASASNRLPDIVNDGGPLKAAYAVHGEAIESGRVYVAPPDNHLIVDHNYVHVVRGPRENGHRPAVDPLFRSAARAYGARVVGVLLTGARDCGTAGLMMIKAQGGIAIVQDPREAMQPDMPRNALAHVEVDYVADLARIPELLARLVRAPVQEGTTDDVVLDAIEAETAQAADIVCPDCGGVMSESTVNGLTRFRCHTGHVFSMEGLAAEQSRALEASLWAAVRALQESETLARRMAAHATLDFRDRFREKAESMQRHAHRIQEILLHGGDTIEIPRPSPPRRKSAATHNPKTKKGKRRSG